ncbi:ATP-binding protein [Pseudomonas sp. ANT_J28]|uniref:ATP-binding protein n=1 Tax=Pseudomonas sp. ANT_J28 TaxID=2597352 RepID=UPI0011F0B0F8|nr:ATP-binding protein [Pseudomonas sp. ANT_J28]KAA0983775.1 AAA family ATPase [Pseudomonas sp. ANT_J28]
MNKIKKLTFYNSPRKGVDSVITVDSSKNILVLTGYNGSGKTRILNMIHESISLVRNFDYQTPYDQWLADIRFAGEVDDIRLRSIKLERTTPPKDGDDEKLNKILSTDKGLQEIFNKANQITAPTKKSDVMRKATDNEGVDVICIAGLKGATSDVDLFKDKAESVLFIDDRLFFSYKRELDELVFDSAPNIDKTLYILINEFISDVAKSAIPELTRDLIETSIKELFDKHLKELGNKKLESLDKVKDLLKSEFAQKIAKEGMSFVGKSDFFEKINRFFLQTNRTLIWNDKEYFHLKLGNGSEVSWAEFSKGEKTLLAILLITFLYKDRAMFIFDEPDLSLHIEWQEMLFPVLSEIAPNAQFIIATHSPALILNTSSEQVINLARLGKEAAI